MTNNQNGVRQKTYEAILEKIVTLQLEPGMMVSENELAKQLNVSRMPVHDALMILGQNHLIDVYPQRGSQISFIDLKWISEVKFIRQTLETAVVLELFNVIREDQLQLLDMSLQKQRYFIDNGMLDSFSQEDNSFHHMLYIFAGREETRRIINDILVHFDRIRYMALYAQPQQPLVEEHQQILDAIRNKDAVEAKRIICQHSAKYEENIEAIRKKYASYFK